MATIEPFKTKEGKAMTNVQCVKLLKDMLNSLEDSDDPGDRQKWAALSCNGDLQLLAWIDAITAIDDPEKAEKEFHNSIVDLK